MDRGRMMDMEERIRPMRAAAMGVLALGLLLCGPWVGFWTLLPLAMAFGGFVTADKMMSRLKRPEYLMFGAWAFSEVVVAVAVALSGGALIPTISWLALPVVTLGARFSGRAVVLGVVIALVLLVAVALGVTAQEVKDNPTFLIAPTALIIGVAFLSAALMQSDLQHRSEAVIDPLTGMLNRNALRHRLNEIEQQSRLSGQPVGLILCDIDHFKRVNDTYGHASGDAVLKDVSYLLRKRLRAFDSVYRVGGEEFLVLLPGASVEQSAAVAEDLRAAVAGQTVGGGLCVTMSFGVSGSRQGTRFDDAQAMAEADASLYAAKNRGRNQVRVTGLDDEVPEAA